MSNPLFDSVDEAFTPREFRTQGSFEGPADLSAKTKEIVQSRPAEVWVVFRWDYENSRVVGVYSSSEKALASFSLDKLNADQYSIDDSDPDDIFIHFNDYWSNYSITKWKVDE